MPRVISSSAPVGSTIDLATATVPTGYLLCDGSAVSRITYAALFAKIGIGHGQGDGFTTFNLPDYRGRFKRMVDGAAGVDPDSASRTAMNSGGNTGNTVGSVQADQLRSHTHTLGVYGSIANDNHPYTGTNAQVGTATTSATGGNETRPVNAYIYVAIRY